MVGPLCGQSGFIFLSHCESRVLKGAFQGKAPRPLSPFPGLSVSILIFFESSQGWGFVTFPEKLFSPPPAPHSCVLQEKPWKPRCVKGLICHLLNRSVFPSLVISGKGGGGGETRSGSTTALGTHCRRTKLLILETCCTTPECSGGGGGS